MPPRPILFFAVLAATMGLSGCFSEVGFAAAKTATLQAKAAKNAIKTRDEDVKKLNEALALQAARNAQILGQIQQQAENPEPAADSPK